MDFTKYVKNVYRGKKVTFLVSGLEKYMRYITSFILDSSVCSLLIKPVLPQEKSPKFNSVLLLLNSFNISSLIDPVSLPVAKPARFLVMQLQILNNYHYSFL